MRICESSTSETEGVPFINTNQSLASLIPAGPTMLLLLNTIVTWVEIVRIPAAKVIPSWDIQ